MLCASLFKKKHNAHKAVWCTKATVHWSNFCIFIDSMDLHIILWMIHECQVIIPDHEEIIKNNELYTMRRRPQSISCILTKITSMAGQ